MIMGERVAMEKPCSGHGGKGVIERLLWVGGASWIHWLQNAEKQVEKNQGEIFLFWHHPWEDYIFHIISFLVSWTSKVVTISSSKIPFHQFSRSLQLCSCGLMQLWRCTVTCWKTEEVSGHNGRAFLSLSTIENFAAVSCRFGTNLGRSGCFYGTSCHVRCSL